MNLVLDVSAAVELVLARPQAKKVGEAVEKASGILVPDLFLSEGANVMWKYHRMGGLSMPACERGLEILAQLPTEIVPALGMEQEVFSLACLSRSPAYDLFYLVLARRRRACLFTLDQALRSLAKRHEVKTEME
jgi:predicted nucleic acid-binding protein